MGRFSSTLLPVFFCLGLARGGEVGSLSAVGAADPLRDRDPVRFSETDFDFGRVLFGTVIKHEFAFTNAGHKVESVKDIRSSCGCAAGSNSAKDIPPGGVGKVTMELHTHALTGPVAKDIKVSFMDTNLPLFSLVMTGTVWRPIEVTPRSAAFSGGFDASNAVRTVWITNRAEEPLALYDLRSTHKSVCGALRTNEAGKAFELTVRLVPPFGQGNIFGDLKLRTSSAELPEVTVPVWAVMMGRATNQLR